MKNVNSDTWVRTIVLFIALLNQILTILGKNPLPWAQDDLYTGLTVAATVVATIWAWWKNNSFTSAAIAADEYMKKLKNGETKNV